ncbi:hypothetical protein [Providencia sp.]|uniref:hypothetical protein n=1 Tax=Providencia sp. TaxID=589 RepID=UPI0033409E00
MKNTANVNSSLDELKLKSLEMDELLIKKDEITKSLIKAIEKNINDIDGESFRGKSTFKNSLELLKINLNKNSEKTDNSIRESHLALSNKIFNINQDEHGDYSMAQDLAYVRDLDRQIKNIDSWGAPMKKSKMFHIRKSSKANENLLNLLKEYNKSERNIANLQYESEILINDANKNCFNITLSKMKNKLNLNEELYDPAVVLADYGAGFEVLREGTISATPGQFAESYQKTGNLGLSMHRTAQARIW